MIENETLFTACTQLTTAGWLLLILSPRRWRWLLVTTGMLIPGLLAFVYAALILPTFGGSEGGFGSLAQVRLLFDSDAALLAGWLHFLAFDIAIGTHIAMMSDRAGILRLVQVPILVLTFMFGPLGYLVFMLIKSLSGMRWTTAND